MDREPAESEGVSFGRGALGAAEPSRAPRHTERMLY